MVQLCKSKFIAYLQRKEIIRIYLPFLSVEEENIIIYLINNLFDNFSKFCWKDNGDVWFNAYINWPIHW